MREIILDTETTGLDPSLGHRVIEIGCIEVINKIKTGKFFHRYINPRRDVPEEAFKIHGISAEFLKDKPFFEDIHQEFLDFVRDSSLVIHNALFDMKFINYELQRINKNLLLDLKIIDTLLLARKKFPGSPASLDALCKRFNISLESRTKHGALLDSELLYDVYVELLGGSQSELILKSHMQNANLANLNVNKTSIKYRQFLPNEEENLLHQKLLSKIANPVWNS
jgi:DNA polymerase-3 subunit epsilon